MPARRSVTLALGVFTLIASGCARGGGMVENERRQLADGAAMLDSLRASAALTDPGAVALGYAERLRLGVASPFRLIEQATGDARLPVAWRSRVAWALLDQARRGRAFAVDTTALGDGPGAPPTVLVDGGWHRGFVDSLVAAAPDARTGEETVRLTYALARAEWLVTPQTAAAAVDAAALVRDRRLAREDAERLLEAPLTTLDSTRLLLAHSWRARHAFLSERPLLADDMAPDHTVAVRDAERALGVLREVASQANGRADTSWTVPPPVAIDSTAADSLSLRAAQRLGGLPSVRLGYPSAPIVVTLGGFHRSPGEHPHDPNDPAAVRARLLARARTDESLAAEWGSARAALPPGAPERQVLARAVQAAAVAVRTFAQDNAATELQPGSGAAARDALRWRDGVRAVAVDPDLPGPWADEAARTLSAATADLRDVFPDLALDGLTVRVGESPRRDLALALHDPARRVVYLPPLTAAGTLAHELTHDLDWQAARAQLAVRGVYATDRAARAAAGTGPLAAAVRTMAGVHGTLPAAALGAPIPGGRAPTDDRPAEIFARGADFFVAAALAREGRMNGTLSAVQDQTLPGYAGVRPPDPGDGTAEALVDVLDTMTLVPAVARDWYLARFGREGVRTPLAIAEDVLRVRLPWDAERTLREVGVPGGLTTEDRAGWGVAHGCRTGPGGGATAPWQARLVWLAADARARGLVRARALRATAAGGAWWGWSAQPLLGGPWRPDLADAAVERMRDAVLRAAAAERERRLPFAERSNDCPW